MKHIVLEKYTELLTESKFNKIKLAMCGFNPIIKSFGIITSQNPMGKKLSDVENLTLYNQFKDLLSLGYFGYRPIKGLYGSLENSFFIPNIALSELKEFAVKFKQESFIFGDTSIAGLPSFYYYSTNNKINPKESDYILNSTRKIYIELDMNREDYYSEYKGKKFIIPFFDDSVENVSFKNGYMIDNNGNKIIMKYVGDSSGARLEMLKKLEETYGENLKNMFSKITYILEEAITNKSRWENRGLLNKQKINYYL